MHVFHSDAGFVLCKPEMIGILWFFIPHKARIFMLI